MPQTPLSRIEKFVYSILGFGIFLPIFIIVFIFYELYRTIRLRPYNIDLNPYVWKNIEKLHLLISEDKSLDKDELRYLMSIPYVLYLPLGQGNTYRDGAYIKLAKCVKKYGWSERENCTEAVYAELKRDWLTPEEVERHIKYRQDLASFSQNSEAPHPDKQTSSPSEQTRTPIKVDWDKIPECPEVARFAAMLEKNINEDAANPQEKTIFAAAMQSENLRNINLARAAKVGERLEFELTDDFFADLGQEEISGGKVHAALDIHASAGDIYKVHIAINGRVTVACDRCLDPLDIEVEASDTVKVKDADPEEADDPELLYTKAGTSCCDLAWCIYEIIETSLPLQRLHPEGECNEEITQYILPGDETDEPTDEEDC